MSLRDYFAGQALVGINAMLNERSGAVLQEMAQRTVHVGIANVKANMAYEDAAAMLAERNEAGIPSGAAVPAQLCAPMSEHADWAACQHPLAPAPGPPRAKDLDTVARLMREMAVGRGVDRQAGRHKPGDEPVRWTPIRRGATSDRARINADLIAQSVRDTLGFSNGHNDNRLLRPRVPSIRVLHRRGRRAYVVAARHRHTARVGGVAGDRGHRRRARGHYASRRAHLQTARVAA